jgi:hypothetical protein
MGYYVFLGIGVLMSTHQVHKSIRARRLRLRLNNSTAGNVEEEIMDELAEKRSS